MTLCISWIRKVSANVEELVIASDSRLRSCGAWDSNPKIFPLPRKDCFISFAGDTLYAYPMIYNLINAINNSKRSLDRFQDLVSFKGFVVRCFNDLLDFRSELLENETIPDAEFILGGYSWKQSKFLIWTIHFDKHINSFTFRPAKYWRGVQGSRKVMLIGNYVDVAKKQLINLLRDRKKLDVGNLDYEPFEVLANMLKNNTDMPDIGGAPQLLKVYKHMNSVPFAVKWKVKSKTRIVFLGRPFQNSEKLNHPLIDPVTMEITNIKNIEIDNNNDIKYA